MAQQPDPDKKEHPSTYLVQDRSSQEELLRLVEQDRMMLKVMGGVLSEQADPTRFRRILDVGCGTGGWLLELARTYPGIEQLHGVDISASMIEYARSQALSSQLDQRVFFQTGDALRMLEFPTNTFDLVNHRFAMSFVRKWDWPGLLREYQRVARPGGIIRMTEGALSSESSSPALARLSSLLQEALYNAGNVFAPTPDGSIAHLAEQMTHCGITNVQTKSYTYAYHTDPQALHALIQDTQRAFRTFKPFFQKWIKLPDDYDDLYHQMLQEIQQPDFQATHTMMTAWGVNVVGITTGETRFAN